MLQKYSKGSYYKEKDGHVFDYLQFRLLAVDIKKDSCKPLYKKGYLILLAPKDVPEFFEKIGMRNDKNINEIGDSRGYLLHPEEILADKFVSLMNNPKEKINSKILERMRAILSN